MFAVAVLTGMIALISQLIIIKSDALRRTSVFMAAMLFIPIILLSGSRRTFLLIWPILILLIGTWVSEEIKKGKRAAPVFLTVLFCALVLSAQMSLIDGNRGVISESVKNNGAYVEESDSSTEYSDRYETIADGSLFAKRMVIWGCAIDEIKTFSIKDLVFGKGGGESVLLYDRIGEEIDRIYPSKNQRWGLRTQHFLFDIIDGEY
jgi:hypothetical protein